VTTPTPPPPPPGPRHSPGPWRISSLSETGRYITVKAANGRTVARVPYNPKNTPVQQCTDEYDALAISLLPQALDSLENMFTLAIKLVNMVGGSDTHADLVTILEARGLINKARGQ
jgi:hypothetical protein